MRNSTMMMPVSIADDLHDVAFEAGRLLGRMEEASREDQHRPGFDGGFTGGFKTTEANDSA